MRWNDLRTETCSVARTVSVIGDRWTILILRYCFLRVRRFEDVQAFREEIEKLERDLPELEGLQLPLLADVRPGKKAQ